MILKLPWPPSVNHYWFQKGNRRFIGKKGKQFREDVKNIFEDLLISGFKDTDRLQLIMVVVPPDKRKRDLDNLLKAPLDALQHAGVYKDDSQIDVLGPIMRHDTPSKPGYLLINICKATI